MCLVLDLSLQSSINLIACEGNSRSLSLDLYDQWKEMDKDGKWRYTSPTHVVAAFSKAIDELIAEGGIPARSLRYQKNNQILRERLGKIGFHALYFRGKTITDYYNFSFSK